MARYHGDPRWITLRRPDNCRRCGLRLSSGDNAFYFPRSKAVYCDQQETCGPKEAADFAAHAFDEDNNSCT